MSELKNELKITGSITKIFPAESGVAKGSGKEWKKISFLVTTAEQYNNLYHFELFGTEKVDKFEQYNSVGSGVDVKFNIECREYNGRYYTDLKAWAVFSNKEANGSSVEDSNEPETNGEAPPF